MPDAQITRTIGTCKTCRNFVLDPWVHGPIRRPGERATISAPNTTNGQCRKNGPTRTVPRWPSVKTGGWCARFDPVQLGFEKIAIPAGDWSPQEIAALFPFDGFWVD